MLISQEKNLMDSKLVNIVDQKFIHQENFRRWIIYNI